MSMERKKLGSNLEMSLCQEHREGGWGWFVCFATFLVNFIVFGIHNSFAVIYANLVNEQDLGMAESAWVGALAGSLNFFCGPLTCVLCDWFSCRKVALGGTLLSISGLFLTSFVQQAPLMYLTYGLMWGVGSSFSFIPSIIMLGKYFNRRLAFANGIGTSGSGFGSLAAGPGINYLLANLGWQASLRILSGVAALLVIPVILYKPVQSAEENDEKPKKRFSDIFDTSMWQNRAYLYWVGTVAVFQFGYAVPFVHLVKYADDIGVPESKGAWLIGILSITCTVGRVVFGKICELHRVNKLYVYQLSVFSIGLASLLCPMANSFTGLVLYCVTFGFFDGCFAGQLVVITAEIVGKGKLSQAVGNMFGIVAVPMTLGPPVAGWLHQAFGNYDGAFYACGGVAILSSLLIFGVSRVLRNDSEKNSEESSTGVESSSLSNETDYFVVKETVL